MDELTRLTTALAERYQIDREIGKGGMATVYLARDVRHNRRVALKLLSSELGAVLGVERFLSEIRVTANLQHPNLLALFDSGEADGLLFYVMPYVDGESLRARLQRERQLPVEEALRLATAVASALDYAHRHGVIHRDLKPENILLHDGQPLVADFGIALAVSNAGGARITQTGLSLGTPQYMSPEQATGDRAIDGRTDIYSLGAVTYEMLTGEPPHTAATAQGVIAKLMVEEPRPLTVLRRAVPPQVDVAVRRALEKLPADRFPTAREFADALNAKGVVAYGATGKTTTRGRMAIAASLGVAAACAIAAIFAWSRLARVEPPQTFRYKLDLPEGQQLVTVAGSSLAMSPDGRAVAYAATGAQSSTLYIRRLDELEPKALSASEFQADLKFSPDGRWISFASAPNRLERISRAGGPQTVIARPNSFHGTSWSADGRFVYSDAGILWQVDSPGAAPRKILGMDSAGHELDLFLPFVLPDGKDVMFAVSDPDGAHLAMASMTGANKTTVLPTFSNILGYLDGWLVYGREDGAIIARKFDQRTRVFSGEEVNLVDGVMSRLQGGVNASLSPAGTLAYVREDANSSLALLDRRGTAVLPTTVHGTYSNPAWSPDGKKIAVDMLNADGLHGSIWIYDNASKTLSRLTAPSTNAIRPAWTPDSKRVAFVSALATDSAVWSVPADLSKPEELFYAQPGRKFREVTFSADGKFAVLRTDNAANGMNADLFALPLQGSTNRRAVPLVQTAFEEEMPSVSPDSRWLAYTSDETGRQQIYVRPFPGGGGHVQISTDGGTAPRWTPDGHLVYRAPRAFWSATLSTATGSPTVTGRDSLFADPYRRTDSDHQGYDIGRDGRFVLFRGESNTVDVVVIANWWTEAQAKLRAK